MRKLLLKTIALSLAFSVTASIAANMAVYAVDESSSSIINYEQSENNIQNVSGLKVTEKSVDSISFSWNQVENAEGYTVYVFNDNTDEWDKLLSTNELKYTALQLKSGTEYKFAVKAYKGLNESSEYAKISVFTDFPDVNVTTADTFSSEVILSWDEVPGADGYYVYQKDGSQWNKISVTTQSSYTVSNLQSATKYIFAVKAFNDKFESQTLPEISVTTNLPDVKISKTYVNLSSAKLSWDKVPGANGYFIYKKVGNQWHTVASITQTNYTFSNLKSGTKYDFAVKAYNGNAKSKNFSSKSVVTNLDNVKITKADISSSTAKLTWNKVSGAGSYNIYMKSGSKWNKIASTTNTYYTVSKLKSSAKYTFAVKAYNNSQAQSKTITQKTITTYLPNVKITKVNTSTSSVKLYWNKISGVKGYNVYRKSGSKWIKLASTNKTYYSINKLKSGTKYVFAVKAYNSQITSKTSTQKSAVTNLPNVKITKTITSSSSAKLYWNKITGVKGYNIYRKDGSKWVKIASTTKNYYTISKLKSDTKYIFAVFAYKGEAVSMSKSSKTIKTDKKIMRGIDVSLWQGNIDFNKVKKSGIDFVIIHAGYGTSISNKDIRFEQNYRRAKAAGLYVGAYWYSTANSASAAVREAKTCMQVLKGKKFDFPVYFDLEEYWQISRGRAFCDSLIKAFCSEIEKNGYYAGLYVSRSIAQYNISSSVANRYALWLAEYSSKCRYNGSYGMWQYTYVGYVSGISVNVDLNTCYVDYPSIIKEKKLNGYK